ncbi:uncharacterized protein L3040_003431 [Drepanopeziza brunnea f. sp. 'multigermtubi']|uniref:YDG/SRA domain-containing protein n=1 Tax=Marssonina brunnea f. sp. multigermtubi (strain MB_m1) TaxID=1072389 RepID=K1WEV1_MARBU|nr:YDG/SRA domain-containing protein [Drepanopeziza brunnea f. sp. 'multigermtubi' MB_m1]EKD15995.1 YDG/SRA domain-containing protein [Drepanopeziza brunnea f. sp. 'multigermtubi' MB_m1]KAJ5047610.1 hypothetical protein L3040_003431 [Drepanopeziza brunnea f. sp. 'multigermtubi']
MAPAYFADFHPFENLLVTFVGCNMFCEEEIDISVEAIEDLIGVMEKVASQLKECAVDEFPRIKSEHEHAIKLFFWTMSCDWMVWEQSIYDKLYEVLGVMKQPANNFQQLFPVLPTLAYGMRYFLRAMMPGFHDPREHRELFSSMARMAAQLYDETYRDHPTHEWESLPDAHPIFGLGGCMHHFQVHDGIRIGFRIDPAYVQENQEWDKTWKVFGHNGAEVGDVWACQHALLRDCVHGDRQSGVSGNREEGAWSVVVGDRQGHVDTGDRIIYESAATLYTVAAGCTTPKRTGAATLFKSASQKKPVRVFRKSGSCGRVGYPTKGLRYDGLYEPTLGGQKPELKQNGDPTGRTIFLFILDRLPGQPGIATNRPTAAEAAVFGEVKRAAAEFLES